MGRLGSGARGERDAWDRRWVHSSLFLHILSFHFNIPELKENKDILPSSEYSASENRTPENLASTPDLLYNSLHIKSLPKSMLLIQNQS